VADTIDAPAMPPIGDGPPLSAHEFWPMWRFYPPVLGWVMLLMLRHRSIRAPLLANPTFPAGGLVGESKSAVLGLAGEVARSWIAPHVAVERTVRPAEVDLGVAKARLVETGLDLPLVAKPDLGCRGAGVRPVRSEAELHAYLAAFPAGARLLLQTLVDWPGEAGVLWARPPGASRGRILSLTLKYFPHVTGDGRTTLRELILADPRAGQVPHLYLGRHAGRLDQVVPAGERVRLAFAGSHSRGAIFRDGTPLVTPAMDARFDSIARDIPGLGFGRFDVRFRRFDDLAAGRGFRIVEVNGAGAEATHIWDSRVPLAAAYRVLFDQWRLLFAIGAANRRLGHRPAPLADVFRGWRRERRLLRMYPETA